MSETDSASCRNEPAIGKRPSNWARLVCLLALFGLLVTAISLFARQNWIADLFAQFKVQWAIGLFVVLGLLALGRQWRWFTVCAIGLMINAIPIWPYLLGSAVQTKGFGRVAQNSGTDVDVHSSKGNLRLLSLNVLTSNRRYDDVVSFIESEDADFVVLLEVDSDWKAMLEPLNRSYPFVRFEVREDNFGIGFLSKQAWSTIEVFKSHTYQLPSIDVRFETMGAGLRGEEASSELKRPFRIIATHPIPPISAFNWTARNEQLLDTAARLDASTSNIMVGDFNLSPWSPFFADVLQTGDLRDSAIGFGVEPSWYVFPTWAGGLRIDHALVGRRITPSSHRIGPDVGSDHRAVILDFLIDQPGPLKSPNGH